jgi:RND family efflux transporter MFP subunit
MFLRSLTTSTAIIFLAFVLVACDEKAPADPRILAPLVRTALVQDSTLANRSFTGTVAARVESDLGFRVSGKVLERSIDAGQTVKRGQVLMRIDPADLTLAAVAQEEAVSAAQARALQTAEDEIRYRELRGTGAISESAYDQAKAAADSAAAQLKAARAAAEVARNARRYAMLVADGEGVVTQTLVEPGQVVNAGQTVVRLAHAGPREAVVQLPETLLPPIGISGQASVFGKEGVSAAAKLRQLSSAADPVTRTFEARFTLDGELANAPLGTTVTIQLASTQPASYLQVPVSAIVDTGKGPGVWVVKGEPATVFWHAITIQSLGDEEAHVSGDLHQGDRVVALGAHLLSDGNLVRVEGLAIATLNSGVAHE